MGQTRPGPVCLSPAPPSLRALACAQVSCFDTHISKTLSSSPHGPDKQPSKPLTLIMILITIIEAICQLRRQLWWLLCKRGKQGQTEKTLWLGVHSLHCWECEAHTRYEGYRGASLSLAISPILTVSDVTKVPHELTLSLSLSPVLLSLSICLYLTLILSFFSYSLFISIALSFSLSHVPSTVMIMCHTLLSNLLPTYPCTC